MGRAATGNCDRYFRLHQSSVPREITPVYQFDIVAGSKADLYRALPGAVGMVEPGKMREAGVGLE
jgi:hypothetical protein